MLCAALSCAAYSLTATAVDSIGEPIPYITFRIFTAQSDSLVASDVATDAGLIQATLPAPDSYRLTLSYVGLADTDTTFAVTPDAPDAILGQIAVAEASEMLQGVTVTAQRPIVIRKIDRLQYDVLADPAVATSSVQEILRKVPMVSVDYEGNIKVNGSSDFKIYKNGRPNNSLSRNAKDIFAAMPASSIKRIEVITDPGAQFDAEGTSTILNIVTNSSTAIKGVTGSASLRYLTTDHTFQPGLYLTSEIDKVTFTINGGYSRINNSRNRYNNVSDFTYADGTSRISDASSAVKGDFTYFGGEFSYQPDTLNLLSAEATGYYYNVNLHSNTTNTNLDPLGAIIGSYSAITLSPKTAYVDVDANINYEHRTHRPDEVYTLSYMLSHTNQDNESQEQYSDLSGTYAAIPYSGINSDYAMRFYEHTIQADYARQLGIHSLDVGLKGIARINRSNNIFDYIDYQTTGTKFRHNTDIAAAYAQYAVKIGRVNFRAGLRYEYSYLKASYPDGDQLPFSAHFNDFAPSAGLNYQINDANSLSANFNTNIQRPGIAYLNPAVTESPTTVSYGNADLSSAVIRSLRLNYSLYKPRFNLQLTAAYSFSNDGITTLQFTDDANRIVSTYDNIGRYRNARLSAYGRWTPSSKTSISCNTAVAYTDRSIQLYGINRWDCNFHLVVSQQLPLKFNVEAFYYFSSGSAYNVYCYDKNNFFKHQWHNIALNRKFLKQDRLSVTLNFINPFGPRHRSSTIHYVQGDYTGTSTSRYYNQFGCLIAVGYRFGSLNAFVKKTDHSITNDDLQGRKQ